MEYHETLELYSFHDDHAISILGAVVLPQWSALRVKALCQSMILVPDSSHYTCYLMAASVLTDFHRARTEDPAILIQARQGS